MKEVEAFHEKDSRNASDRISSKNKNSLDEARKMYREEVFEDMKSNGRFGKTFYISRSVRYW